MPFQILKKLFTMATPMEAAKKQLAHAQVERQRSRLLAEEALSREVFYADQAQRLSMFIMENDDGTSSTLEGTAAAAAAVATARKPRAKAATA